MSITVGIHLAPSATGLALEWQPIDAGGVAVGSLVTTGFVELGGGHYQWVGSYAAGAVGAKLQNVSGHALLSYLPYDPADTLAVDASGRVTLTPAEHTAVAADTQTGLSAQGYTPTRAGYLDTLNGLVAAIWAAGTRTLTSWGTLAADVWAVATRTITGGTITTNADKTGYSLSASQHTAIAADVLDALIADHLGAGTVGAAIQAGGAAGDPWATDLPGAYTGNDAGAILASLLARLTQGTVVVQSALSLDGGQMRVVAGDTYEAAVGGRAFVWVDTADALAGFTIASAAWSTTAGAPLTKALTPLTIAGHKAFQLELSAAETATFLPAPGKLYSFALTLTLSDGDLFTWKQGTLLVRARTP